MSPHYWRGLGLTGLPTAVRIRVRSNGGPWISSHSCCESALWGESGFLLQTILALQRRLNFPDPLAFFGGRDANGELMSEFLGMGTRQLRNFLDFGGNGVEI